MSHAPLARPSTLPRRTSAFKAYGLPFTLAASLLGACGGVESASTAPADTGENAATESFEIVPDGKADNYYSGVAAEFEVTGRLPVVMTKDEFNDEAKRADLVSRRLTAFGLYLTTYVTEKFRGIDHNGDGVISDDEVFFKNEGYGGFHAMVRNFSVETLDVSGDPTSGYAVTFTIDLAGPRDLLSRVDLKDGPDGGKVFEVKLPKNSTVDPAAVPRGEVRNFNPATFTGEIETIGCQIEKLPDPANAFPRYDSFTKDGVYDLTLFYGHDYNTARSDLSEARSAFELLQDSGFKTPVDTFEALNADSGVFTRVAKANGQDLRIDVRIYHSDMFTTDRRRQHDLAVSELVARDVFFYNGHAGPYFGFYLDEARVATVNYLELAGAPFSDKQQLVIAQGCQTYSQYADMLYASPAKSEENLDVITTVNYSYGQGTDQLLASLIKLDDAGNHRPVDFYTIVGDLNSDWLNDTREVFYGVMGIDGNPQLHPYANVAKLGEKCETSLDCGDADGNVCLAASIGPKVCGVKTLTEAACPEGTKFQYLARGATITTGACLKL